MSSRTYLTYELKRTFRNRRFFFFSLAFPLLLFLSVGGSQRDTEIVPGVPFLPYYMVGMAGWGAMTAVLAGGARISHGARGRMGQAAPAHAVERGRLLPGQDHHRLPDGRA